MDDRLKMYSEIKKLMFKFGLEFRCVEDYEEFIRELSYILYI